MKRDFLNEKKKYLGTCASLKCFTFMVQIPGTQSLHFARSLKINVVIFLPFVNPKCLFNARIFEFLFKLPTLS